MCLCVCVHVRETKMVVCLGTSHKYTFAHKHSQYTISESYAWHMPHQYVIISPNGFMTLFGIYLLYRENNTASSLVSIIMRAGIHSFMDACFYHVSTSHTFQTVRRHTHTYTHRWVAAASATFRSTLYLSCIKHAATDMKDDGLSTSGQRPHTHT